MCKHRFSHLLPACMFLWSKIVIEKIVKIFIVFYKILNNGGQVLEQEVNGIFPLVTVIVTVNKVSGAFPLVILTITIYERIKQNVSFVTVVTIYEQSSRSFPLVTIII